MKQVLGKHMSIRAGKYFFELMPDNENDLDIEPSFEYNTRSIEDLFII